MESRPAGDLRAMLCVWEREWQSTYRNLDPTDRTMVRDSLALAQFHLGVSTRLLMKLSEEAASYKNGAVVLHYDANCADIDEFITTPREALPWVKRCVNITPEWWADMSFITKGKLIQGIKAGDIWLNKVKYHGTKRIRGNVCLEVYLPSRGTCLLQHVNLGQCTHETIPDAFVQGMQELCDLHRNTGVGETGEYLSPDVDKQVGLGLLGLANLLRRYRVTYEQFGRALDQFNAGVESATVAYTLVKKLNEGLQEATAIALRNGMARAFAIAPTASCSYRSKDLDGYTCTPEIAPPIARTVDRDSGLTFGVQTYEYGDVEIASEVGWDNYKRVADGIMSLYSRTGLLHGYSFNWWSDMTTMGVTHRRVAKIAPDFSLLQPPGNGGCTR